MEHAQPPGDQTSAWQRHQREVAWQNHHLAVTVDQVTTPAGHPGTYTWVELAPAVRVVARRLDDQVALVREYVYTHQRWCYQLPGGGLDPYETDPRQAAVRELWEETGCIAGVLRQLATVELANAATNQLCYLYEASELEVGAASPHPNERLDVEWVPISAAMELIQTGELREAGSVAAVLLAATTIRCGED